MFIQKSQVQVSFDTVQRVLFEGDKLHFGHLKVRAKLEHRHIKAQKRWAKEMSFKDIKYGKEVIFLYEKRFSLDGPHFQSVTTGVEVL